MLKWEGSIKRKSASYSASAEIAQTAHILCVSNTDKLCMVETNALNGSLDAWVPKQKWNVNSHSILTYCSPSTHLIRCALQVSTRWALQKWNREQNISWVLDVYWVSTRWALGEYWQRCLRRCALGEYCTCLEVCTRWALDLDNLCRWILGEYWT